jgi:hypothetical protein
MMIMLLKQLRMILRYQTIILLHHNLPSQHPSQSLKRFHQQHQAREKGQTMSFVIH